MANSRYSRLAITSLLVTLLLLAAADVFAETDPNKQLRLLRERMQRVEAQLTLSQRAKTQEQKALRQLDKKLGVAAKQQWRLSQTLAKKNQRVKALKKQQTTLQQAISGQKDLLAEQLRSAHMMGKQQRIKMLLNQQQADRMSRVMQYYAYFNQARVDNVRLLDKDIQQLQELELQLQHEQTELTSLIVAKRKQSDSLAADKKKRKRLLFGLAKKIKSSAQTLVELKDNEKRLTRLLASIQQAINDIPVSRQQNKPFISRKGKLNWPVKGRLWKRFGSARKSGRYDGVVISASEGSSIRSISHGRVVYADWLRGYGLLIIVDHGADYLSLYAFNESLYKEVGDWVETGESIATVGLSGGQTKAGLYFSIRKKGKPVNPIHWCRTVRKGRVG
ncbi:peptidase M23 [Cycloclasticus sp. 46_120_T64]|nr:peptidase M23 [Cycloclasticus sp. 46_120_T64]